MNDTEFHADLAHALRQLESLAGVTVEHEQAAATASRPLITVSGDYTPYGASYRKGETVFEIRTRSGDGPDAAEEHSGIVSALMGALTNPGVNAVLRAAVLAKGQCEVVLLAPRALSAEIDGEDLRTEITANCAWRFV